MIDSHSGHCAIFSSTFPNSHPAVNTYIELNMDNSTARKQPMVDSSAVDKYVGMNIKNAATNTPAKRELKRLNFFLFTTLLLLIANENTAANIKHETESAKKVNYIVIVLHSTYRYTLLYFATANLSRSIPSILQFVRHKSTNKSRTTAQLQASFCF